MVNGEFMKKRLHQSPSTNHHPRILLTNDDGINATGLAVLEKIAAKLSEDVWVVAPETEQSGAGHSLTLHLPVRVREAAAKRYAVSGTPTDCVLLGLKEIIGKGQEALGKREKKSHASGLLPRALVNLILSGVNRGSNVGDDITYSGTVAGAMEGTNLEVPSIALSQLCDDTSPVHWETAEQFAPDLIRQLVRAGWPGGRQQA